MYKKAGSDTKHSIFAKPSSDELANRLSRATKPPDYQRRGSASSLSSTHPVYFSQIKISLSFTRLARRLVRVRGDGSGAVLLGIAPPPGRSGTLSVLATPCVTHVPVKCTRGSPKPASCLTSRDPPTTSVGPARSPTSRCCSLVNMICMIFV